MQYILGLFLTRNIFYTCADALHADSHAEHTKRVTVVVTNLRGQIHENLLKKENI